MSTINRSVCALVICGLFLVGSMPLAAGTYYVTTTGNDANTGASETLAWRTIRYAATKAKAGDTVYIKVGLYNETAGISFSNSGTAAKPIVFEGYKVTPRDNPTYSSYKPGDTLNSAELPVLKGTPGHQVYGINVFGKSHIKIRNLGVTTYQYGVFPQYHSSYITLENLFVTESAYGSEGNGIFIRDCDYCTIRNCVVVDSLMCNIVLQRTNSTLVDNCRCYAVSVTEPTVTDYHIVVADSRFNWINNCSAENLHWQNKGVHTGHGIGIKDQVGSTTYPNPHSTGNRITNCVVRDCGEYFFVAHEAHHNTFANCNVYGQYRIQNYWSEGINIRDGAHHNTFNNCRVEGARTSIAFQDTTEGPHTPAGANVPQYCTYNTLVNCVFFDSNKGIEIGNADYNTFKNCVFDHVGVWALVQSPYARVNVGNSIRNSIVTNVPNLQDGAATTMAFTYTDFYSNYFGMPAGTGNLAVDPLYADAANLDFHLKSAGGRWNPATSTWVTDTVSSPCIDAGNPSDAYSSEPGPNGARVNMGAYGNTAEASKTPRATTTSRPTGRNSTTSSSGR